MCAKAAPPRQALSKRPVFVILTATSRERRRGN
jgi:hypothetical protein